MDIISDAAGAPAPGFQDRPDHKIEITRYDGRVRASLGGATIADTRSAVALAEDGYGPVFYLPLGDFNADLLRPSDHTTYCPFKGTANYYSIAVGDRIVENAVWYYASPYREVGDIAGRAAFYTDRLDSFDVTHG